MLLALGGRHDDGRGLGVVVALVDVGAAVQQLLDARHVVHRRRIEQLPRQLSLVLLHLEHLLVAIGAARMCVRVDDLRVALKRET